MNALSKELFMTPNTPVSSPSAHSGRPAWTLVAGGAVIALAAVGIGEIGRAHV